MKLIVGILFFKSVILFGALSYEHLGFTKQVREVLIFRHTKRLPDQHA